MNIQHRTFNVQHPMEGLPSGFERITGSNQFQIGLEAAVVWNGSVEPNKNFIIVETPFI